MEYSFTPILFNFFKLKRPQLSFEFTIFDACNSYYGLFIYLRIGYIYRLNLRISLIGQWKIKNPH